jgi:hypothetical protein
MTRREWLHRCYYHQELDRPGVYLRTNWPANDPSYDDLKALMGRRSELKGWWRSTGVQEPPAATEYVEPVNEDWQRWVNVLHTPAGDLRQATLLSLKGQSGMAEERFIKTPADAERFLSQPMPKLAGGLEAYRKLDAEIGEAGFAEVDLGSNPGGSVAELMGSELFAIWSIEHREILHALCRWHRDVLRRRLQHILALGGGPYFCLGGQEFIVPPLHGPADCRDFNTQYDTPIVALIHEAGGAVHVHCHGRIARVIDQLVELGANVLHPFEAPPLGDITARQAKAACRGRCCLEGNIQIADMYLQTPDNIRMQVAGLVRDVFDDHRGLIVSASSSAYQFGKGHQCLPQFQAMVEAVETVEAVGPS